ncbi:CAunnamed protein product [Biomphalaria glabrata]|nr:CAunnamed protein product [Biomphalaria glabrata]
MSLQFRNKQRAKNQNKTDQTYRYTDLSRSVIITMEKSKASIIARLQSGIQCTLRPGVWLPGIRNLHSHKEKWKLNSESVNSNLEAVVKALTEVIQEDKTRSYWLINKKEVGLLEGFLQVFVYTRAEWLDIIEIKVSGKNAEVWSFSSGFLPLCVPFACLLNPFLFWIPFHDMKLNKHRINKIISALHIPVERSY